MNLTEALAVGRAIEARPGATAVVSLCSGFTSEHLGAFLRAHLAPRLPTQRIEIRYGLFGDLLGNVEREADPRQEVARAVVVVVEWPDLDERLGVRRLGGWRPVQLDDMADVVRGGLARLATGVRKVASRTAVVLSTPTLALPLVDYTHPNHLGRLQAELDYLLASFARDVAGVAGVRVVNPLRLGEVSPVAERRDLRSELYFGSPLRPSHASALAELLAPLIVPAPPKKGLITDLDDTLWAGLVGEVGPEGVSWDQSGGAHGHGLYQQMVDSLAGAGVLVAVASKNDPVRAKAALARSDLALRQEVLFPLEVGWGRKSESVARILNTWNIGADAVVFVDDSPMELAEVQVSHPGIECLRFPGKEPSEVFGLLHRLRHLFGRPSLTPEDLIRTDSLRQTIRWEAVTGDTTSAEAFLGSLDATLTLALVKDAGNARPLDLINKTNQFNANGRRMAEPEWLGILGDPDAFVLSVGYRDKFGPLGTIAIVVGKCASNSAMVVAWVMSCRAFSRRIEHRTLAFLFEHFRVQQVSIDFEPTARNGPFCEWLESLIGGATLAPGVVGIRREVLNEIPSAYMTTEAVLP